MSSGTNSERITQNNEKINSSIEKINNLKVATFQDLTITENGTYQADEDYSGLGKVVVNVEGGNGDVKLFKTEEEMQADTSAQEGDLAVVYRNEVQNWDGTSPITSLTFPKTVTLSEVVSEDTYYNCYGMYSGDTWIDFNGDISSTSASFRIMSDNSYNIQYTSEDGLTYTRTDSYDETITISDNEITLNMYEWSDVCGNFIQIIENTFEGLYQYGNSSDKTFNLGIFPTNTEYKFDVYDTVILKSSTLYKLCNTINELGVDYNGIAIYKDNNGYHLMCFTSTFTTTFFVWQNPDTNYYHLLFNSQNSSFSTDYASHSVRVYDIDLDDGTLLTYKDYNLNKYVGKYVPSIALYLATSTDIVLDTAPILITDKGEKINTGSLCQYISSDQIKILWNTAYKTDFVKCYNNAPTQLTTIDVNELMPNKIIYSKSGIVEGDGSISIPDSTYTDIPAQLYFTIQQAYDNMDVEILTDDNYNKFAGTKIVSIPIKSDGTLLIDVSNVTNMNSMFQGCSSLTLLNLSSFNTSNVTNMTYMFYNCSNLADLDVSNFDTSNVTNMSGMIRGCTSLTKLDLSNFDTSNVQNMGYMFYNCSSLQELDLSSFDFTKVTSYSNMFNNVPTDCLIYVKDSTAKSWITSKFTTLTNVQVKS